MKKLREEIRAFYQSMDNEKKILFWVVFLSILVTLILLVKLCFNGFWIWGNSLQMDVTGQFGDFIGGVIGTILSGAGFYFLYVTLVEQRKSFERERFETRFFEMLKIYKENVHELNYKEKHLVKVDSTTKRVVEIKNAYEGRKVFKIIYHDFTLLYEELSLFFTDVHGVYNANYLKMLKDNSTVKERKIDILELARVDITYCIIFFGLSSQDRKTLTQLFERKYNKFFVEKLIVFAALKPKEHSGLFVLWEMFHGKDIPKMYTKFENNWAQLYSTIDDAISDVGQNTAIKTMLNIDKDVENIKYDKYYGGHQFRLGHYFRHLYVSINYINENSNIPYSIKYENIKLLRAQLSSFEQKLIFLNSISTMGRTWELEKLTDSSESIDFNKQLITKYNLLKNIPNDIFFKKIKISTYYPLILSETNYNANDIIKRRVLEEKYS